MVAANYSCTKWAYKCRPSGSKISLVRLTGACTRVRALARRMYPRGACSSRGNFLKFDSLRWLLRPFLATNAAARTELCYSCSRGKRRTLQLYRAELCYISLASPALSLQTTSTHISSLHEHVAARKILESLKNWSGHGLSNRTGSADPEMIHS